MTPLERAHYSETPIDRLDMNYHYVSQERFKPTGLWYSAPCGEDGWEHWCEAEDFGLGKHKHLLEVDLSRVLVLRLSTDILCFHEKYGLDERYEVDWDAVAKKFSGIEIAPYQWSLRLDSKVSWYYPWDCASGCIWDLSIVKSWRPAVSAPVGSED